MWGVIMSDKPRKLNSVYHSCKRKFNYRTWEDAERAAERRTEAAGHEIQPYDCRHCGGIHIGRITPC